MYMSIRTLLKNFETKFATKTFKHTSGKVFTKSTILWRERGIPNPLI